MGDWSVASNYQDTGSRPRSAPTGYLSTDLDGNDAVAFNALVQEALKVDRMNMQHRVVKKKLEKIYSKLCRSEEKVLNEHNQKANDVHIYNTKNKMLNTNLDWKKKSLQIFNSMAQDLERQLRLEQADKENKKKASLEIVAKYQAMWGQYQTMYMKRKEAQGLEVVQERKKQALENLDKVCRELQECNNLLTQQDEKNGSELRTAVKDLAQQGLLFNREKEKVKKGNDQILTLQKEVEMKTNEVTALENQLASIADKENVCKNKESLVTKMDTKTTGSFRDRLKSLVSFETSMPELELPTMDVPASAPLSLSYMLQALYPEMEEKPESEENVEINEPQVEVETFSEPEEMMVIEAAPLSEAQPELNVPELQNHDMSEEHTLIAEDDQGQDVDEQTLVPEDVEDVDGIVESQEQEVVDKSKEMTETENLSQSEVSESETVTTKEPIPSLMNNMLSSRLSQCGSEVSSASSLGLLDDEKRRAFMRRLMASPTNSELQVDENRDIQMQHELQIEEGLNPSYLGQLHQMFQSKETPMVPGQGSSGEAPPAVATQQDTSVPMVEAPQQNMFQPSTDPFASSVCPLFGIAQPATQQNQAFGFGGFQFSATSTPTNDPFQAGGLFGAPASTVSPQRPEVFNVNFTDKSNTPSIFKLF